jgi:hypothetical protein
MKLKYWSKTTETRELVNDNTRKFGSQIYTAGQRHFAKEHFQISVMMHHSMFNQAPQTSPCHVVHTSRHVTSQYFDTTE